MLKISQNGEAGSYTRAAMAGTGAARPYALSPAHAGAPEAAPAGAVAPTAAQPAEPSSRHRHLHISTFVLETGKVRCMHRARKHPYAALLCHVVLLLLVIAEPGQTCLQATLIDSTYLLLEGVSATTPWLRTSGAFTKAGVVDTSALLSPAFASLPEANASGSWLDGGADAALVARCCGGQRLVIPVRLNAPGYAPEVATAAFNASVLQTGSNMSSTTAGGVVAGLFQERPGGGGSLEDLMLGGGVPADQANAASAPPELITRVPARAVLANATLFIDTTFAGPKWARQRAAAGGGGQAEAGGTKAASVDLSGTGVNTAASTCSNPANPDCPNYDPKLDPACQALSPPPPARCNRTVNSAAGAREGATTQQTGIINGAGSAYSGGGAGGYGGYGYGGYGYGGCVAHTSHPCPLSGD